MIAGGGCLDRHLLSGGTEGRRPQKLELRLRPRGSADIFLCLSGRKAYSGRHSLTRRGLSDKRWRGPNNLRTCPRSDGPFDVKCSCERQTQKHMVSVSLLAQGSIVFY